MDTPPLSPDERAERYVSEFREWKAQNDKWLADVREDEDAYQGKVFSRPDSLGERRSLVSRRSLAGIVESTVAKLMAADPQFSVPVKGAIPEVNRAVEQVLSSVYQGVRDNPAAPTEYQVEKERAVRDLEISGTALLEINWDPTSESAYWEWADFSELAYHPAYTIATSPCYRHRKWVSLAWIEEREEDYGLTDVDRLRQIAENDGKRTWRTNVGTMDATYVGANGQETAKDVEALELFFNWDRSGDGWTCQITCEGVELLPPSDFLGINEHNLAIAISKPYKDKPLGTSALNHGRGLAYLQDEAADQRARAIERSLKIAGIVTDPHADMAVVQKIATKGGLMRGSVGTQYVPIGAPQVQPGSFQDSQLGQQDLERVMNYAAYSAGLTNQVSDQTKGTATGIREIKQSAAPIDDLKLRAVRMLDRKFARVALKMAAANTDEFLWALRAGGSQEYVKVTKALMSGKFTFQDLIDAGCATPDQVREYTTMAFPADTRLSDGTVVPANAPFQSAELLRNPYLETDWVVDIILDGTGDDQKRQEAQAAIAYFQSAQQAGEPVNMGKVYADNAAKLGVERYADYLYSPEEIAKRQAEDQAKAQAGQQAAEADAARSHAQQMALLKAKQNHDVAFAAATAAAPVLANPVVPTAY